MKRIIYVLTIVLLSVATKLIAQPPEGRQFDPVAMKEKQKTKLIEELKLTNAQADSVATIQLEFMPKLRGMRGLQAEERLIKMKEVNDAYKTRLTSALKDEKLVTKVIEFQEKQRQERMERMRAGE